MSYRDLTSTELDELLISLTADDGLNTLSSSSFPTPVPPPLSIPASKRRPLPSQIPALKKRPNREPTVAEQAERLMDCDEIGLPVAVDEDTRKARKMARNRRAAAVSRERKKQRLDELEEQVAALQQENAWLKRRLAHARRSGSETSETTSDVEPWPLSQQPEVFWTYAPLKQACTPPHFHTLLPRLIASLWMLCLSTLCRLTSSTCSVTTTKHASTHPEPSHPQPQTYRGTAHVRRNLCVARDIGRVGAGHATVHRVMGCVHMSRM
eukprot:CAMPEP_0119056688 /NCGR_PEP_ID=MMETSP1178-20130426/1291_1 /TAXON_ID=33656 /ORGANISM="unid sp, Strain CCMP2000" /LENGTH=266 /DNA_ID=CAMNT_0007037439 /DNA_START=31 /DNA_END=832 /DNA_ORIENTATION=-